MSAIGLKICMHITWGNAKIYILIEEVYGET